MERIGIWIGVFFTFCIFSFLYKDNPFYKVAEQVFVGLSAGYWFMYTVFSILKPNLYVPLTTDFRANWILIIPAILGFMMLVRLIPKIDWLSRFPISLMIGTTAGVSLIRFLQSDVINQLSATMINPFKGSGIIEIFGNFLLIIGTFTGVIYFYFSKKHEGVFGGIAKIGVIFLMISFGSAFGYTTMARISLLIGRLQFLLGDWLHIIAQ